MPQDPERPPQSDLIKDYLKRQVTRIYTSGGGAQDVQTFLNTAMGVPTRGVRVNSPGQPRPATPDSAPHPILGMGMAALQGVSFGFADEAIGSLIGAILPNVSKEQAIDRFRSQYDAFREEHKALAFTSELAGGFLVPGAAALRAFRGIGKVGRGVVQAVEGGASAALAGAGETEGGISERLQAALNPTTAALGVGIGGGAGALLDRAGGSRLVRGIGRSISQVTTDQNWGKLVSKGVPQGLSSDDYARQLFRRAIEADGVSGEQLRELALEARNAGQRNVSILDLVAVATGTDRPANTFGLIQAASSLRDPRQQELVGQLLARQGESGQRMLNGLFRELKLGTANISDTADELMSARFHFAEPQFEAAYSDVVEMTSDMRAIFNSRNRAIAAEFQDAYNAGRQLAGRQDVVAQINGRSAGAPVGQIIREGDEVVATLGVRSSSGELIGQRAPITQTAPEISVRGIDRMKDKVEERIESLRTSAKKSDRDLAQNLEEGLDVVLREARMQSGAYDTALTDFPGLRRMREALDSGESRFVTKRPDDVANELAALGSQAEKEMYQLGALRNIYNTMEGGLNQNANLHTLVFGTGRNTTAADARFLALFEGDQARAKTFSDLVRNETGFQRIVQEFTQKTSEDGGRIGLSAGQGSSFREFISIPRRTIGAVADRVRTGTNRRVSNEIANLATRGIGESADPLSAIATMFNPRLARGGPVSPIVIGQEVGRQRNEESQGRSLIGSARR